MELLETDNCWPGTGWTGGGTEGPTGWRQYSGDTSGVVGPCRPMAAGAKYVEFDFFWDTGSHPTDSYMSIGIDCQDTGWIGNPRGKAISIKNSGDCNLWSGWTFLVGSQGMNLISAAHNSAATAATVGIGSDGPDDLKVYVNRKLVLHATNPSIPVGTCCSTTSYNYMNTHYGEVRFYDATPVPSESLLEIDNCWEGHGWEGGGVENPTGWRHFAGSGNANLGPRRPMPAGTVYAEFDFYWDATAADVWTRVGLSCVNTGAQWDPNGYSVLISGATGELGFPPEWNNGTFALGSAGSASFGPRNTPATAATIGIGVVDGDMVVFADGVLVYRLTGNTAPLGAWVLTTAYNGLSAHFNEVRFYNAVPENTPSGDPLLEVDDCWPGNGWVGGGTESPTGWRYYGGVGNGNLGPRRAMPPGTAYAEFDVYWDGAPGDRWLRMGLSCPSNFTAWNPGGYPVRINPNGTLEVPSEWYNGTFIVGTNNRFLPRLWRTAETAGTIGIGLIDGDMVVYVNGELWYRLTGGTTPPLGAYAVASAYNGMGGHYDEVRFYDTVPESVTPPKPPLLIETDDCWPGNGWEGGGSESPVGWRYYGGAGTGVFGPHRPMPEGTVYAEFDCYWDAQSADRFLVVGLSCVDSGYLWDANGYHVRIQSADGKLDVAPELNNGTYLLGSPGSVFVGVRNTPATAVTIGIANLNGEMAVFVEGEMVYRIKGGTNFPMGLWALATAYNGGGGHYDEVRFYSDIPSPQESKALLQVDLSPGVGAPVDVVGLPADINAGIAPTLSPLAGLQAEVNAGIAPTLSPLARLQADVYATPSPVPILKPDALIQVDLNVPLRVHFTGGSGNMPIGPGLLSDS